MTTNLTLAVVVGVLMACGISLIMARGIIRSFLGVVLAGNAINLMFVAAAGPSGAAPMIGTAPASAMSDPLPQALTLTAIVITLALTGFVLALAHRAWQLSRSDAIVDDAEDARIARRAAEDDESLSDFVGDEPCEDVTDDPGGPRRPLLATALVEDGSGTAGGAASTAPDVTAQEDR